MSRPLPAATYEKPRLIKAIFLVAKRHFAKSKEDESKEIPKRSYVVLMYLYTLTTDTSISKGIDISLSGLAQKEN